MNAATRIAIYGTRAYDRQSLEAANDAHGFDLTFIEAPLTALSAKLATGCRVACVFVNDVVDREVLHSTHLQKRAWGSWPCAAQDTTMSI